MNYLVVAWDNFSRWAEARALYAANTFTITRFLYEEIICRYGCFQRLILNREPETKEFVEELA